MEIRKLKPEENIHRILMSSICFSRHMQNEDRLAWLEKPEEHTGNYENAWGAFDNNNKLVSAMVVDPAKVMINGKAVKAGLIAAVTTLPEARNAGGVRMMFDAVIPHMKNEGMVFSILYPFSFEYYRKFGYEHNYVKTRINFPISELSHYPYPKGMKSHDKNDSWEDMAYVYNIFSKDKNMAMVRSKNEWDKILRGDPHKSKEFAYIHMTNDKPDSYVLYKAETKDNKGLLNIKELTWTSTDGLRSILGFIYGMRSEYDEVSWALPTGIDVFSIVSNPCSIILSYDSIIMTRVVDVQAALNLIVAPSKKGSVVLGIKDKFMKENSNSYLVSWDENKLKTEITNYDADMELDIETLVQLSTGYTTIEQTLYRLDVCVHNKMDELTALFPKKNQYMMESF